MFLEEKLLTRIKKYKINAVNWWNRYNYYNRVCGHSFISYNCHLFSLQTIFRQQKKAYEENKRQLDKHHDEIIRVYKDWKDIKSPELDFYTFDPNCLTISLFKENQIEKYAVSHLKSDENIYNKYIEISQLQKNLNSQISKFLNDNKQYLIDLIGAQNVNENNLRYFLNGIVKYYENNGKLEELPSTDFMDVPLDEELQSWSGKSISFPSNDVKNKIIKDINSGKKDIIDKVYSFEKDVEKLESRVIAFKDLLDTIITDTSLGLKGSCQIEDGLKV